jgi:hypothetical protein
MKSWYVPLIMLILVGCSASESKQPSFQPKPSLPIDPTSTSRAFVVASQPTGVTRTAYPDLGPAPELAGEVWLNSPGPLRISELRGKVVLVDMWTFG